ncbi:MAG: DUF3144 domain-containing protein [Asticcacaulis sp.]|nr:DUF3144 domain-containing protein [Asticcacaulis sp.]MBW8882675.1 DUF3144 domain-containing protein [Asticcacaulis sp.]
MTETTDNPFVRMATAFIDQANAFSSDAGHDAVATALLHATARYVAFATASNADSPSQFAAERDGAVDHFTAQFREAVAQHYDDYATNFETYLGWDKVGKA